MEFTTDSEEHSTLVQNLISKKMKMKNSIYLLMMFLGLALTSCEPMEDIHDDLDAQLDNRPIVGMAEYTLTNDDYTADVEDGGLGLNFPNFSSLDEAGNLIPQLLTNNFPVWGEGSLAQVTFNLYAPIRPKSYTVTAEGYDAVGLDGDYFSNTSKIKEFLAYQFPQAGNNDYVELTYRTVAVEVDYELIKEDFSLISTAFDTIYPDPAWSAGNYDNFERRESRDAYWSNEMILEAINVVLSENFPDVEGQTYEVSYKIYDGSPGTEKMKVRYDGNDYVFFGAEAYTLAWYDYDLIGEEFATVYPDPASSAAQYSNFDIRESEDAYWSNDMILEAINVVLMDQFPNAEEGAQFDITYKTYNGSSSGYPVVSVVLENGEYVIDESSFISTIEETTVFAHGDNIWMLPMTLPEGIYTEEFEQRYNNFGSEADAGFYIGRWLEPRFPYAQQGDFVSVEYKYFSGGVVTRYASFIYDEDEREWEFIPSVIEQTLQFGNEASGWVVDNTIVYTLVDPADYEFIGEQLADKYVDPAWSVGNYSNFDRRPGNANQWTDVMLLEALNILLNEKVAPNAEEGQKYLMIFDIYNGTNTVEQMHLIKENGVWVPVN